MLEQQAKCTLPQCSPTAVLRTPQNVLVATSDGQLLLFDTSSTLQLRTTVPLAPGHSITALHELNDGYVALIGGRVAVFDVTLDEQERLPFKDVSCYDVHDNSVTLATRNTVLVYSYIYGHLEMFCQWRLPEKITCVKAISPTLTIVASNTNFYTIQHSTATDGEPSTPTIEHIEWKAGFTIRSQAIDILPYSGDLVLLRRGSTKCIYDTLQKSVTPVTISGAMVGNISPFFVVATGNHIHLHDHKELRNWCEVKAPRIVACSVSGRDIAVITKDEVIIYTLQQEEDIINSIDNLQDSIKLLRQMKYEGKSKKLRELEVRLGTELFIEGNYQQAIKKFTDFCATPIEVICLYPPSISGKEKKEDEQPIDEKAIRLLTHFLTDTRRKLQKLLNEPSHRLPYDEGILTLDIMTGTSQTVEQIQTAIDTTLFKCYTLINPGLIGSLIRVENHCDPQLVVQTLKEGQSINDLIDFYFKRGMHKEALDLLLGLAKHSNTPDIVVKYLHRLKGDQLPLIIEYSNWPIEQDEGYGINIFIDSPFSDTFDKFKVMKHLQAQSDHLERMFLEFIIFELHEPAMLFHTRLVELYLSQLDPNPESIHYKKLHSFLQTGRYDNKTVLNLLSRLDGMSDPALLRLKTITLGRMGKHEDVLRIFVNDMKNPTLAIKYIQEHNTQDLFLYLISLFQVYDEKASILHLLSTTTTATPLLTILGLIPQLKVVDLQTFLLKSIRVQHKKHVLKNLEKSLLDIERVAKTQEIGGLESKRVVIDDDTNCHVCMTKINGSVFVWDRDGKSVRHFGCKGPKEYKKMKSITLKEFNERQGQLI